MNIYWGDIHNHNYAGTAFGSMERSLDIARSNLDFFAFTGQSQWHDMKVYENGVHEHWLKGFAEHKQQWPDNVKRMEAACEPGRFVSFHGYEWHSSFHGDYNLIYPGSFAEFREHKTMDDLVEWAKNHGAIIVPHHLGYPTGRRGANWDTFEPAVSPVVEIFSEHGCSERDEGPFPYIRHGLGARMTKNSYQFALERGLHIGVTAGTDNHIGVPGAYGEGLTAVIAKQLDRESVFDAIRSRRVYAVSGDRIGLQFRMNGHMMGEVLEYSSERHIEVEVDGWDRISLVEVLKNNKVIHRHFIDAEDRPLKAMDIVKCRIDFGWGPWGDLKIAEICDWDMSLRVLNGEIAEVCPCFVSGPFDEQRRSKLISVQAESCSWVSYTRRKGAFEERPSGIVFELKGGPDTELILELDRPGKLTIRRTLNQLIEENYCEFVGGFQSEMVLFHRPVVQEEYRTSFSFVDRDHDCESREDFYYVRVTQDNGQMAWSSPIWVGGRDER